jgi:predicted P-loop ATPase
MKLIVSYGQHAADVTPSRHECSFEELSAWVDAMQPREGTKDGPYLVFADFGPAGTRDYAHLQASYAVPVDLDRGGWSLERIAATLNGYQWLAWTTYKHTNAAPRWRVVVPVSRGMGRDEHRATWEQLNAAFCGEADAAAKDATRLNYLPGACLNPAEFQRGRGNGVALAVATVPAGTQETGGGDLTDAPAPGWNGPTDDEALIAHMLAVRNKAEDAFAQPGTPSKFEALWYADAAALAVRFPATEHGQAWDHTKADLALANDLAYYTGGNGERVVELLNRSGLAQRDSWRDDKARRAAEIACRGRTQFAFMRAAVPAGTPQAVSAMGDHQLSMNRRNQFEATIENLVHVLTTQNQGQLGYDKFRGRVMTAPTGTNDWRPINDTDMIQLRETLGRTKNFAPVNKELMRDALQLVAERQSFDAAMMWLTALEWDGVPRVERFLATHCGAVDDEYSRAVSRYIWSGLAGRVLAPGCQLDMVVALQSPQGKKKSTGLQAMVPDPEFFTDGLSLHEDDDNFKRLMRGKLVVEIAEMAGLTRGDINVVKRAITRRYEEWIEKFQTQPTRYPRRCMLFATTNDDRFLPPDETGNRRWLPVEIASLDRERITADQAQLWAEGAAIYKATGIAWQDAERLAGGRHQRYEQTDVWESEIAKWLETPTTMPAGPPPKTRPLAISDVLAGALGMHRTSMDAKAEKRAGRVLRQLGYEVRAVRVGGRVTRRWVPVGSV